MPMSAEQRKAASDRMKAMHATKKAAPPETLSTNTEDPVDTPLMPPAPADETVNLSKDDFQALMARLSRLESAAPAVSQQTQVSPQGRPVGVNQRYSLTGSDYEDPRERLYDLPELVRFGFRANYMLDWLVSSVRYQTADGLWFIEPKFELACWRRLYDDLGELKRNDDGELQRALVGRVSMFEDPADTIVSGAAAGVSVEEDPDSISSRNKMRYYRCRVWLVDKLQPPRADAAKKRNSQTVIGGNVVELESYSALV